MTPGPLARLGPWYGAAPSAVAVPHHVPSSTSRNRFNDGAGAFALRYFAADPVTALLEAVALHGSYATGFVPAPPPTRPWTVFRYDIAQLLTVISFADPAVRTATPTTTQELTGDWLGYHHRKLYTHALPPHLPRVHPARDAAPTQRLANRVYGLPSVHGFLSPSAKSPLIANLVLFFGRLPAGSVRHTGSATSAL